MTDPQEGLPPVTPLDPEPFPEEPVALPADEPVVDPTAPPAEPEPTPEPEPALPSG